MRLLIAAAVPIMDNSNAKRVLGFAPKYNDADEAAVKLRSAINEIFSRRRPSFYELNRFKRNYFLGPHFKFESAVFSLSCFRRMPGFNQLKYENYKIKKIITKNAKRYLSEREFESLTFCVSGRCDNQLHHPDKLLLHGSFLNILTLYSFVKGYPRPLCIGFFYLS